jgi:hypothetical protein
MNKKSNIALILAVISSLLLGVSLYNVIGKDCYGAVRENSLCSLGDTAFSPIIIIFAILGISFSLGAYRMDRALHPDNYLNKRLLLVVYNALILFSIITLSLLVY